MINATIIDLRRVTVAADGRASFADIAMARAD